MIRPLRGPRPPTLLPGLLGLASVLAGGGASAARGTLRVVPRPDGGVSVVALPGRGARAPSGEEDAETLVDTIGFELAGPKGPLSPTSEGEQVVTIPALGRRKAGLCVGPVIYWLTSVRYRTSTGTVFDFRAAPERLQARSAWEDDEPIRVRLAARLAPSAMKGGRVVLRGGLDDDRMVTLGAPEKLGPDVSPGNPGGSGDRELREKAHGRSVELYSVRGTRFYIETETPGEIEIAKQEDELVVRFAGTLVDPDEPFAYAVFVGEEPYAGPPVLLGEPEVRFREGHACFEVGVRAFGAWSRPAYPADAALRLSGTDRLGYYTRDFVSTLEEDAGGNEAERLRPRGWPYFALRVPYSMSGSRIGLSFETTAGAAGARVVLPTVNTRQYASQKRRLSGPTFVAPGPRGTVELTEAIARLADEGVSAARFLAFEKDWALLEGDPGEINPEAAWRIDRAVAEAGSRAVRLVIVHEAGAAASRLDEGVPAMFMRKLVYSQARWGAVRGFAASAIEFRGGGRAGAAEVYVRPSRGRFEFAAHEVLSSRTHQRLWEGALESDSDVYTDPLVGPAEAVALARFMSAVPDLNCDMTRRTAARLLGCSIVLRSGRAGALWYVRAAKPRSGRDRVRVPAADLDLCVDALEPGRYRLEWWDPRRGRILTSSEVRTPGGTVYLVAPDFGDEIAGRLVKLGE